MEVFTTCGAGGRGTGEERDGKRGIERWEGDGVEGEEKRESGRRMQEGERTGRDKATLTASSTHRHTYPSPNGHTPISANGHNCDIRRRGKQTYIISHCEQRITYSALIP